MADRPLEIRGNFELKFSAAQSLYFHLPTFLFPPLFNTSSLWAASIPDFPCLRSLNPRLGLTVTQALSQTSPDLSVLRQKYLQGKLGILRDHVKRKHIATVRCRSKALRCQMPDARCQMPLGIGTLAKR